MPWTDTDFIEVLVSMDVNAKEQRSKTMPENEQSSEKSHIIVRNSRSLFGRPECVYLSWNTFSDMRFFVLDSPAIVLSSYMRDLHYRPTSLETPLSSKTYTVQYRNFMKLNLLSNFPRLIKFHRIIYGLFLCFSEKKYFNKLLIYVQQTNFRVRLKIFRGRKFMRRTCIE